jgi:hypothetical protein
MQLYKVEKELRKMSYDVPDVDREIFVEKIKIII